MQGSRVGSNLDLSGVQAQRVGELYLKNIQKQS
jgi:hypothetical protein